MAHQIVFGHFVSATTSTADRTLTFVYGPEHQRIRQTVALSGNGTSSYTSGTTWYLNGVDSLGLAYEKHVTNAGLTEHKHYVSAGSQVFALHVTRSGNLGTQTTSTTSYLHTDHLGSVAVITDTAAAVAERLAYDPWGKRRFASGLRDHLDAIAGQKTDRGYTLHEHLDEVGVVHMNARVYDPLIGRFMSADSVLPDPTNLKAFNRYSYVSNNPLALVDPTGHLEDAPSGGTVGTQSPGNGSGGGCLISMGCGWPTVFIADSWDSAGAGKDLPAAQGTESSSESDNSPGGSPGNQGAGDDSYQLASAARFGSASRGAQGATGGAVPPQQAIDRGQSPTVQLPQVIMNVPSLDAMRFGVPMFVPFIGWWVMESVVWSTGRIGNTLNVNSAENAGADSGQWQVPEEAREKVPAEWGDGSPNRKGDGVRWQDPNDKGSGVRIDKGNPENSQPSQQVDHVVVRDKGKVIGRDGQAINGSIKENPSQAHIPLTEWLNWSSWNKP